MHFDCKVVHPILTGVSVAFLFLFGRPARLFLIRRSTTRLRPCGPTARLIESIELDESIYLRYRRYDPVGTRRDPSERDLRRTTPDAVDINLNSYELFQAEVVAGERTPLFFHLLSGNPADTSVAVEAAE